MGVNSLPKTVTRQRRGCDLNLGPSAPESSMLITRLPSHPGGHSSGAKAEWDLFNMYGELRAAGGGAR